MKTRRFFRLLAGCVGSIWQVVLATSLSSHSALALPTEGPPVHELKALDEAMLKFMNENNISAGQIAVMRHDQVVLERSYGWRDRDYLKPLPLRALMRVASVSKLFTAAAVQTLVAQKKLSLDAHIFSLKPGDGGLLEIRAYNNKPADHIDEITVEHCLNHRGGWDRHAKGVGDLTYQERKIAEALHKPSPPERADIVSYIMAQELQFTPGAKYAYSNIGYLLLGLVIEKISGKDYLAFVHDNVSRSAGINDNDLKLARSLEVDADSREPHYSDDGWGPSVFDPGPREHRKTVPLPYGSFHMEARTGQGAIITNARSLVLFLDHMAKRISFPYHWELTHMGEQPGAESLVRVRRDGIIYAAILNKRAPHDPKIKPYADQLYSIIEDLIDCREKKKEEAANDAAPNCKITDWPAKGID
jgi:CubicO group peptidase (beta-lactamase class C family)